MNLCTSFAGGAPIRSRIIVGKEKAAAPLGTAASVSTEIGD
jgi:hypothetical protein